MKNPEKTEKIIEKINTNLNRLFPQNSVEEFLYLDYFDEQMRRAMEEPDHQDEARRLAQFYM